MPRPTQRCSCLACACSGDFFPLPLWERVLSHAVAKRVRGVPSMAPSPGANSLRSFSPPSPTRGEGKRKASRFIFQTATFSSHAKNSRACAREIDLVRALKNVRGCGAPRGATLLSARSDSRLRQRKPKRAPPCGAPRADTLRSSRNMTAAAILGVRTVLPGRGEAELLGPRPFSEGFRLRCSSPRPAIEGRAS
jgi:hypothetical protein